MLHALEVNFELDVTMAAMQIVGKDELVVKWGLGSGQFPDEQAIRAQQKLFLSMDNEYQEKVIAAAKEVASKM